MKIGILTAPFENKELKEVAKWASTNKFNALEIACWPKVIGKTRRYAGTAHIDVGNISQDEADEVVGSLAEEKLFISGLGYYPNPLHEDESHREEVFNHLKKIINCAKMMNVKVVNTKAPIYPSYVLFGLIADVILFLPINFPLKYADISINDTREIRIIK